MELNKPVWKDEDFSEFQEYIKSLGNPARKEWCVNILNTALPVLVIKTPEIKSIVKQIAQGNYLSFLDRMLWEYYENTAINGMIINLMKDFETVKKYLDIYSKKADNWATCDLLTFRVKGKEKEYFDLALEYASSPLPFVRRIGINILFPFVDNDEYIDRIFNLLDTFSDEEHYYVNMVNAWLLCDCFIKQRTKTLRYLENNKLNKFTVNKAVQKCRDSFRVSAEDKEMLLKFKK